MPQSSYTAAQRASRVDRAGLKLSLCKLDTPHFVRDGGLNPPSPSVESKNQSCCQFRQPLRWWWSRSGSHEEAQERFSVAGGAWFFGAFFPPLHASKTSSIGQWQRQNPGPAYLTWCIKSCVARVILSFQPSAFKLHPSKPAVCILPDTNLHPRMPCCC